MQIAYEPIGFVHSPITDAAEAPRFFTVSDIAGTIEILEPFREGLKGLASGDRIIVLFHFHLAPSGELIQCRRGTGEPTGVFNLCSPVRPNPIGLSVLTIRDMGDDGVLRVEGLDMIDKTPILDIKPFRPFTDLD